jgi:aspartyl-tRNA(Asn)/glutamyl-tRNA(Gln) amidotransferase subunit C
VLDWRPMRISPDEVRTTAAMARLALSPDDVTRYAAELSTLLDYVAKLQEVDVTGVQPTTHALPLLCPLREDTVGPHLPAQVALRGAPATENGLFSVPAIFSATDAEP